MPRLWYPFILILLSGIAQGTWDRTRSVAEAQQPAKLPRLCFLSGGTRTEVAHLHTAFRQGLRELGHVEGQNIAIEDRYADGNADRLPGLAAELVSLRADVIVVFGMPAARAAKNATKTIPIVFAAVDDPVSQGLVASVARPGGNMTGVSLLEPELSGKRLELLKEAVPPVRRVFVLVNPANPAHKRNLKETGAVAQNLGVTLQSIEVRGPDELEQAFAAKTKKGAGALIMLPDAMFHSKRRVIVNLAAKNRLPAMYTQSSYVEAGGLMSYGPSFPDMYRRAATYVDKILKGNNPAELPVEGPIRFELVINLNTAKKIGLTIPPEVLMRADKAVK